MAEIFDDTACKLGEGPLWHPGREQLFWFDIRGMRLHSRTGDGPELWQFGEHVSAAGWIDRDTLLIASETKLFTFNLATGASDTIAPLEADIPATRSNDGRADPWGGFWIGTMAKTGDEGIGAIYRYYRGEVRPLFTGLFIPNAISFDRNRGCAYFADTSLKTVWRQRLDDGTGWPVGDAEIFLDFKAEGLLPDGAVVASDGTFWNAQWGSGRVAAYDPEGRFLKAYAVGGENSSCPAFGGPDLTDLYCTTAHQGLSREAREANPENGMTFVIKGAGQGLPEPRVIL
ncbi:SMP-30/gluconolactonase/LRE family protein [Ovoidimarina sediminis]|uniref:SMP-30/gluconolactonase/LRE family protein n=1 Tax=Ovoidimarina sediminis TaxID=3079856 RepID=UPI00290A7604|nr:SMP-30/gluconolactonase/LRE family protein [Rhodophyticola sp. MJ-SS7]MDU8942857.1 SMP-30/gluconolactonase/LRE family protein [Rhodophyticola sp. MJ-SS7]